MKKRQIKKIYIRNFDDSDILCEFLVKYDDGSSNYFGLSSFYDKLNDKIKRKEEKILNKKLKSFITTLEKESISSNFKNNSIVIEDKNTQFSSEVDKEILIKKAKIAKSCELLFAQGGMTLEFLSIFSLGYGFGYISSIAGVLAFYNYIRLVISNLVSDTKVIEKKALKKIRLSLGLVLLSSDIGVGIRNIQVNLDQMNYKYNLATTSINHFRVLSDIENPFSNEKNDISDPSYATDILIDAVSENPLINEDDYEIISEISSYLNDNPYLDYEKIYERFASFGIVHSDWYNNFKAGSCRKDLGVISLFDVDSEIYSTVLQHEFIHLTGCIDNVSLNEGMTELLNCEYFNDGFPTTYENSILLTKIVCELIGPDKMLEAYSKEDTSIIEEELLKINPDKESYDSFMNELQNYGINSIGNDLSEIKVEISKIYPFVLPCLQSGKLTDDSITAILDCIACLNTNYMPVYKSYFNTNASNYYKLQDDTSDHTLSKRLG